MLFQIHNGTVSMEGEEILSHIDFQIKGTEKVALVGRNGAGKTTLLRLLAGELEPDRDDKLQEPVLYRARSFSVGILHQNPIIPEDLTLEQWMRQCGRGMQTSQTREQREVDESGPETDDGDTDSREYYAFQSEFYRMLTGFGMAKEEANKPLTSFSGGERTKIMLIRLLLMRPELLLLDEPTNHLDLETVEWLEQELRTYPGAVVLISHDRFFVDRVATVVWEVRERTLTRYAGGYTDYRKQKRQIYEKDLQKYKEQQERIRKEKELIERFKHKPNKASFARSRKKMLERMEVISKPIPDEAYHFATAITPRQLGSKWVLEADHLEIGYEKTLLELNLRIRRGQKIGIIGSNGTGKTTFLKTIMGRIPAVKGKYSIGNHVEIGYYDQNTAEQFRSCGEQTVYQWFQDRYPSMLQQDTRKILEQYLFTGRLTATPVADLSGGEKGRLALCDLLTACPNFLVLDEPTNHMDIPAKETLESAFRAYSGTILFVSHDRYFLSQIADALLVFEEGQVYYYPFGYEHYLERKKRFAEQEGDPSAMAALVQAENAALIEGMRAVPKREHHETRQMTSDEAHKDWQLRLADDPMQEAKARVEELLRQRDKASTLEEYERLQAEVDAAEEEWTRLCGDWYEVWDS